MFLLALFIGIILTLGIYYLLKVDVAYLAVSIGTICIITAVCAGFGYYTDTTDYEVLNGEVTGKQRTQVSCSHSYDCHCKKKTSGSGKNKTTVEVCDTCYEHDYDYNWDVGTTVGDFRVKRKDSQGIIEPPRWTEINVGDPSDTAHQYTNYVKASPDSIFYSKTKSDIKTPDYPEIYDYYNFDHVINAPKDSDKWNLEVAKGLTKRGALKQVNLMIVFTNQDKSFADALHDHWLGGKKNDLVVVIGSKQYPNIDWVKAFSWSDKDIIHTSIRDDLMDSKVLDPVNTTSLIFSDIDKNYHREPMAHYKYLVDGLQPGMLSISIAFIINILVPIITLIMFYTQGIETPWNRKVR